MADKFYIILSGGVFILALDKDSKSDIGKPFRDKFLNNAFFYS